MSKSEEEFMNEGMSAEEITALQTYEQAPTAEDPAATPEAPAEQQAQAEGQQPDAQKPEDQRTVDVRALQEARAEARAAREESARIRDERIRLEERLDILNKAIQAQNQPQQQRQAPSKDEDPLGYYDHQLQTLEQRLAKADEMEAQRVKAAQAEQQYNDMTARAGSYLQQAAAVNPQVDEALNFAFDGLRQEIQSELARHNVPPHLHAAEGERMWRSSMARLAQRLPADPQQAAEFVFRNARFYGWNQQAQQATAPAVPDPKEVAARQERHLSLSNAAGGSAPAAMDAKTLAGMSDKQFNAWMKSVSNQSAFDEILGAS